MSASQREIQFFLVNGVVVRVKLHELTAFLQTRNVILLLLMFVAFLFTADEYVIPSMPISWVRIVYFVLSGAMYFAALNQWVLWVYNLWQRLFTSPVPQFVLTPLLIILIIWATQMMTPFFAMLHPDLAVHFGLADYLVLTFLAQLVETIALVWLWPIHLQNLEKSDQAEESKRIFITLDGQSVDLEEVRRVVSHEHYLVVYSVHGSNQIRERMKTLLSQVNEEHGIQVHRSCWISTQDFVRLDKGTVTCSDGEQISVSRGRRREVEDWARLNDKTT